MIGFFRNLTLNNMIDYFFSKKEKVTIRFPKRLDFEDEAYTESFFKHFEDIFNSELKNQMAELIFEDTEFIYPSALIFFASMVETLPSGVVALSCNIQQDSPVHEYVFHCGFDRILKLPRFNSSKSTIASEVIRLQEISGKINESRQAKELINLIEKNQTLSPMVRAATVDSFEEIFRNINQHSSATRTYFIAQTYPRSNRVRFVIYDNGVGIKSHLTRIDYPNTHQAFKELISEDLYKEMKSGSANISIQKAAVNMVSGTDYTQNSGAGLNFVLQELSVPTNGKVSILSEDGLVMWKSGKVIKSFGLPFKIKGTLVSVTIDVDPQTIIKYKSEVL